MTTCPIFLSSFLVLQLLSLPCFVLPTEAGLGLFLRNYLGRRFLGLEDQESGFTGRQGVSRKSRQLRSLGHMTKTLIRMLKFMSMAN